MEFFTTVKLSTTAIALQERLCLDHLGHYCSEIDQVLRIDSEQRGSIYCAWGEFIIERQLIHGGLRFTLPHCPNALSWTITTTEDAASVVIHATINRTTHDTDFIESIEAFINSWKLGLEAINPANHNG